MHYWQDFLGLNSSSGQSSQYNILLQDYGFESARLYSVVLIHGVSVVVSMVVWCGAVPGQDQLVMDIQPVNM